MVTADLSQIPEERLKALAAVLPKAAGQCVMQYAVVPTVHTQIGGVSINELTETGVPGLYAACEVTGGVHGANRLGGNALTEAWVFGAIAGREAAARARQVPPPAAPGAVVKAEVSRLERIASGTAVTPPKDLLTELQDLMWRHAGLIRRADDLDQGLRRLEEFRKKLSASGVAQARELPRAVKLENMRRVGEMIMRSALARTESRGSHYRSDYPAQDDAGWMRNVTLRRDDAGMKLETAAVKSGPVPL